MCLDVVFVSIFDFLCVGGGARLSSCNPQTHRFISKTETTVLNEHFSSRFTHPGTEISCGPKKKSMLNSADSQTCWFFFFFENCTHCGKCFLEGAHHADDSSVVELIIGSFSHNFQYNFDMFQNAKNCAKLFENDNTFSCFGWITGICYILEMSNLF